MNEIRRHRLHEHYERLSVRSTRPHGNCIPRLTTLEGEEGLQNRHSWQKVHAQAGTPIAIKSMRGIEKLQGFPQAHISCEARLGEEQGFLLALVAHRIDHDQSIHSLWQDILALVSIFVNKANIHRSICVLFPLFHELNVYR